MPLTINSLSMFLSQKWCPLPRNMLYAPGRADRGSIARREPNRLGGVGRKGKREKQP